MFEIFFLANGKQNVNPNQLISDKLELIPAEGISISELPVSIHIRENK